jgi:3-phenylpropionate/trans-cinnamate dioxygenase ferredoxin reductase subunit
MGPTFVIIGASLAGGVAAAVLRQAGFDGDVVLVGAERNLPYERPPLSKQYLRGEVGFEKSLVRPAGFYEQNRIETLLGVRATHVNPHDRTVELDSGRHLHYDKLLIATGVRNRRPPIPGLTLEAVFDLRSVADADALRSQIVAGRKAVVIGMGFIGCEVAASLRQKQVEVVGIDPSPTPLFRAVGQDVGRVVEAIHREHGVETILDDAVTRFEGAGRVERVITKRGRVIECDFAVVGVGGDPVVDLVDKSGVEVHNGIVVDQHCRSTVPDIYAAGDVANHYYALLGRRIRVEHWQNAMQQGAAAARNMLGMREAYSPVHWFWSDQYDLNLQYAGSHDTFDEFVVRGSLQRREFLGFFLKAGRVDAIVALNRGKDLRRAMPLIEARENVTASELADEDVDLRTLLQADITGGR